MFTVFTMFICVNWVTCKITYEKNSFTSFSKTNFSFYYIVLYSIISWKTALNFSSYTAWKVSQYGVFSGPYFPAFGLNKERYGVLGHFSRSGRLHFAEWISSFKSSRPEVFLGKGVVKICRKFTGEHPCQSAISIKLLCNIIEIILWHGCSPVNVLHIFRTPFPRNTSGWLLLMDFRNYHTCLIWKVF